MANIGHEQAAGQPPVVIGEPIFLDYANMLLDGWDDSHGVSAEVAGKIQEQIGRVLAEREIELDKVLFSGYPDWSDAEAQKAESGFDTLIQLADQQEEQAGRSREPSDGPRHIYFFGNYSSLADGQDGPVAFAATQNKPAIGVYDFAALRTFGLNTTENTLIATHSELRRTQILEFRPTYRDQ